MAWGSAQLWSDAFAVCNCGPSQAYSQSKLWPLLSACGLGLNSCGQVPIFRGKFGAGGARAADRDLRSIVSTHAHGTFPAVAGCGQRHHRVRVHAPTATLPASRLSVLTQPVSAAKPVCLSGCHQHHPATTHTYRIPHLPSHVAMIRELTGALWLQPTKHAEALAALIAELSPCGLVAASTRCFQPPPTLPGLLVSITV